MGHLEIRLLFVSSFLSVLFRVIRGKNSQIYHGTHGTARNRTARNGSHLISLRNYLLRTYSLEEDFSDILIRVLSVEKTHLKLRYHCLYGEIWVNVFK